MLNYNNIVFSGIGRRVGEQLDLVELKWCYNSGTISIFDIQNNDWITSGG